MAFSIRDSSSGNNVSVKSATDGSDQVPHHNVDHFTLALPVEMFRYTGTVTDNAVHAIQAAVASKFIYLCAIQVINTSGTDAIMTIQDGANTLAFVQIKTLQNTIIHYPIPLATTSTNTLQFQMDGSYTSIKVSAQGYIK